MKTLVISALGVLAENTMAGASADPGITDAVSLNQGSLGLGSVISGDPLTSRCSPATRRGARHRCAKPPSRTPERALLDAIDQESRQQCASQRIHSAYGQDPIWRARVVEFEFVV